MKKSNGKKAPALFIGHGSPLNVIIDNQFNHQIIRIGQEIENTFKAVICFSAHYQTHGIQIDGNIRPRTIHDFYGFPPELYQMHYNAPGNPDLALEIKNKLNPYFKETNIATNWGLDHGAWNILWHLIPKANIPVVMISLDYNLSFEQHFQVGKIVSGFRDKGVMILGSGNIVHSFKGINFSDEAPKNNDAIRFENYVKKNLVEKNFQKLIHLDQEIKSSAQFSINSSEHYIPLLSVLGSLDLDTESIEIFNDEIVYSTLSMLSFMANA